MPSIVQNKRWFHPGSIGVSGFRQSCGFCISTFWVSATSPHRALMPKTRIKIQNLFSDLAHEVWRKSTTLASSCPYSAPLRPASNRFRRRPSPIATMSFKPPTALPPSVLLPPRPGGGTRADWLPAAQASSRWGAAGGRDCGNRGLLPVRTRLPRTPPAQPQ